MAVKTFEMKVKLPNKTSQIIRIQADDAVKAKAMAEAQYGKGCVQTSPKIIR